MMPSNITGPISLERNHACHCLELRAGDNNQTLLTNATDDYTEGVHTNVSREDSDLDALFYIVVVLAFYAFAMVVLMVKYIRRENQEAELAFYFDEFIQRTEITSARHQNRMRKWSTIRLLRQIRCPKSNTDQGQPSIESTV